MLLSPSVSRRIEEVRESQDMFQVGRLAGNVAYSGLVWCDQLVVP